MQINCNDTKCWMCGEEKKVTVHHAIPKHFNPKNNVLVPLCRPCHDKFHSTDIQSVVAMMHKLTKQTEEHSAHVNRLKKDVDLLNLLGGKRIRL